MEEIKEKLLEGFLMEFMDDTTEKLPVPIKFCGKVPKYSRRKSWQNARREIKKQLTKVEKIA